MSVILITGDHPRHRYFVREIIKEDQLDIGGIIVINRELMLPFPPNNINNHDRLNWERHFIDRKEAEITAFTDEPHDIAGVPVLHVDDCQLSNGPVAAFVKSIEPTTVVTFGCGVIRDPLLSALPDQSINLHMGLSPKYKGAATLFWPFYMLEPNWAGGTIHYISNDVDGGKIIHQFRPELYSGWGIHDVGVSTVKHGVFFIKKLLQAAHLPECWKGYTSNTLPHSWYKRDFKPEHLRVIYDLYDNKMVDAYLNGELKRPDPDLIECKELMAYET